MKTISSCFLYIAVMCPLVVICALCLVSDIVTGEWKEALIMCLTLAIGIWTIRGIYKRAKAFEMLMLRSTLASEKYIIGEIMDKLSKSDFSPKEPEKGKTDEVEADK